MSNEILQIVSSIKQRIDSLFPSTNNEVVVDNSINTIIDADKDKVVEPPKWLLSESKEFVLVNKPKADDNEYQWPSSMDFNMNFCGSKKSCEELKSMSKLIKDMNKQTAELYKRSRLTLMHQPSSGKEGFDNIEDYLIESDTEPVQLSKQTLDDIQDYPILFANDGNPREELKIISHTIPEKLSQGVYHPIKQPSSGKESFDNVGITVDEWMKKYESTVYDPTKIKDSLPTRIHQASSGKEGVDNIRVIKIEDWTHPYETEVYEPNIEDTTKSDL